MIRVERLDGADPATARALVAIQRAAYRVEAELIGAWVPVLQEEPAAFAATGLAVLAALDERGAPAGFVAYARKGEALDIHRLVVHPRAFRRGMGTALLAALEREHPDVARIVVEAAGPNAPALALYEGRGYRRIAERRVPGGLRIVRLERRPGR